MFRKVIAVCAALSVLPSFGMAEERAMIVLDASGSMWGQIDGKTKIEIARETLGDVLGAVPEESELGLMVYGHRRKGDCADIELAVPADKGTAAKITAFANTINPKGKTPLSAAVKKAAEALKFTEDKATVILVTDGLETCEMDPCALARELEAAGVDFTTHVVGFGLSAEEGAQVSCLAEETGGNYLEARSAAALGEALSLMVVEPAPVAEPAPTPEPVAVMPEFNVIATAALSEGGPVLKDKALRWSFYALDANRKPAKKRSAVRNIDRFEGSLAAGEYRTVLDIGDLTVAQDITVSETEVTTLNMVLNAGIVTATATRTPGGDMEKGISMVFEADDFRRARNGKITFYAPAGKIDVTAKLGNAKVEQDFDVIAGESMDVEVVVPVGVLATAAVYSEGGPAVETRGITYYIYEAKPDINGKLDRIRSFSGAQASELLAGDYKVEAKMSGVLVMSDAVHVTAGERINVVINLNAGVVGIKAPGAKRIAVLGKPNMQGKREEITKEYSAEFNATLPGGTYLVRVQYADDRAPKEAEVTVIVGERVEATIE